MRLVYVPLTHSAASAVTDEARRGRKAKATPATVLSALKKKDLYDPHGKLKKRTDPVWQEVSDDLGNALTAQYIYVSVHQDKQSYLTDYCAFKGLRNANIVRSVVIDESQEPPEDLEPTVDIVQDGDNVQFQIILNHEKYTEIEPTLRIYRNGSKKFRLQSGWADTLADEIYRATKLAHVFAFENHDVCTNEAFIRAWGNCTVSACNASILVKCYAEPGEKQENIEFSVWTKANNAIPHAHKKRNLANPRKLKVQAELEHMTPRAWRLKKANESMNRGDPKPPDLHGGSVLSKARQEMVYKKLALHKDETIFKNFKSMKDDARYAHFLRPRLISFDRFSITYFSEDQIQIGNYHIKVLGVRCALDLTGKVIIAVNNEPGDSRASLYGAMVIPVKEGIFPVIQWLSEESTGLFIQNVLQRYRQAGGVVPRFMATDMSLALQNGISPAFNGIPYRSYLDVCIEVLQNKKATSVSLPCQMAIDISHLIHAVANWPSIKSKPQQKKFYLQCVGLLAHQDQFPNFMTILDNVMKLALSPKVNMALQTALEYLITAITSYEAEAEPVRLQEAELSQDDKIDNNIKPHEPGFKTRQYWANFLQQCRNSLGIFREAECTNEYHNKPFAKRLIVLCEEMPCWTRVMNRLFNNSDEPASTGINERYFGLKKGSILDGHRRPVRADVFVARDCIEIDGQVKLVQADVDEHQRIPQNVARETALADFTVVKSNYMPRDPSIETLSQPDGWGGVHIEPQVTDDMSEDATNNSKDAPTPPPLVETQSPDTNEFGVIRNHQHLVDHDYLSPQEYQHFGSSCAPKHIEITHGKNTDASTVNARKRKSEPTLRARGMNVSKNELIRFQMQTPVGNVKNPAILLNGNLIATGKKVTLSGKNLSAAFLHLQDTCPFDSITEVITHAYRHFADFRSVVDRWVDSAKALFFCATHQQS
ncbi:hypothetical protein QAD02_001298 [Eretmocerus hayati]|uniref:Uncharacterized protein n=1 Tax=Eretmocerus hayati TaxID=131215 RepID=A0ACC2NI93_9HYME|nr:hypothetical protein QAD02_001298 [Eretmocerus hayati]